MALMQPYIKSIYEETIEFEQAYHKIELLTASIKEINITVEVYRNEKKETLIDVLTFTFDPTDNKQAGTDLIQVGYELLKTLHEYNGAINVFEEGQPVRETLTIK